MNHDHAITIEDYEALDPALRPITDDPIHLRQPRALDDVDPDELEGFSVIELDDDPRFTEADDWLDAPARWVTVRLKLRTCATRGSSIL